MTPTTNRNVGLLCRQGRQGRRRAYQPPNLSTGVTATNDLDTILAAKPDCVVYTAMADNRLPEALEDYRRILAAGVQHRSPARRCSCKYPWQVLPMGSRALEDAAKEGNSSLFVAASTRLRQ